MPKSDGVLQPIWGKNTTGAGVSAISASSGGIRFALFYAVDEIFFSLIRQSMAVTLGALAFALFASYNPRPLSLPTRF